MKNPINLQKDPELRRLQRRLVEQQDRLRAAVDPATFQLYLDVEETSNLLAEALAARGKG